MGFEDEISARRRERSTKSERFEQEAQGAWVEPSSLLREFAAALANDPELPRIPVYDCLKVKDHRGIPTNFHPTRTLLGTGWRFDAVTYYADDGTTTRSPLVLMDDRETLVEPILPRRLSRREWGIGDLRINGTGFWPRGDFVCWGTVYEVRTYYGGRGDVDGIRHDLEISGRN